MFDVSRCYLETLFWEIIVINNRFDQGYQNGYDADTRGKYDKGRSRSPEKGSGWGDCSRNSHRERSRSRSLDRAPAGGSFHKTMMERGRFSPQTLRQHHKSSGEEAEEGMIPQDADGLFLAAN